MKFDKKVFPFLRGEEFSNRLNVKISGKEKDIPWRFEFLTSLAAGKKVIHLGFADHYDLIEIKRKEGLWLHDELCRVAGRCLGVDIDLKSVEYIKNALNISDVICSDIAEKKEPEIVNNHWDYIVCAEVIEHLENPILFLKKLRTNYAGSIGQIIVTAPNAFYLRNFLAARHHLEIINSDHKFWFTPYTLAMILTKAGFEVEEFYFCEYSKPTRGLLNIKLELLKRFPSFRETLVMVAKF